MSKEWIEHEVALTEQNVKYAQQEFQLDCKKRCIKDVGYLHSVEGLKMEVETFVLNSLGNEQL